jgi:hypothetical protein
MLETVRMALEGSKPVDGISARADKSVLVGDEDGNGIEEIGVYFSTESLSRELAALGPGPRSIPATIEGGLVTGARFRASLVLRVVVPGKGHAAAISPNPMNPAATLSFVTTRRGHARVTVFDAGGRAVGSLFDVADLPPGSHTVPIDARAGALGALGSGVYFYRVETLEAVSAGRFVVLR